MSAPIAQLDDEWENFSSFSTYGNFSQNKQLDEKVNEAEISESFNDVENAENLDVFRDPELISYESMEDLVHTFDEKLAACFRLTRKDSENNIDESCVFDTTVLSQDALWKRLTDNYGLVQPLNWETSRIRKLHIPALSLPFQKNRNERKIKDEELRDKELEEQMDYHRMIEYNVYTEDDAMPYNRCNFEEEQQGIMQTADEVIEELEEIMQDAADINAVVDYEVQQETGIIFDEASLDGNCDEKFDKVVLRPSLGSPSSQEESDRASELKCLSLSDLNALCEDIEAQVNLLSSELLENLKRRDELQYENEVKNTFISKVLEVQYKQEQFYKAANAAPASKKFARLRRSATTDSVASQGRYLTTVIPSNKGDVLNIENLLVLIKILNAIKADSDEVPSLLTSYILKVLCPAPSDSHVLKL